MHSDSNSDTAPVPATGAASVRLKVCGVTRPEQAAALRALGADYLGLNFHPPSPRFVPDDAARRLVDAWGDPGSVVGVFVDRSAAEILACKDATGIGIAQLHGSESVETIVEVARAMPVIRAYRIRDAESLERARAEMAEVAQAGARLHAALIDGYAPDAHGGTGVTVAEHLVRLAMNLHPRLVLAGGLKPANLAERLEWCRPWCVDVASGVESAPGVKDLAAVESMLRCLRSTFPDPA